MIDEKFVKISNAQTELISQQFILLFKGLCEINPRFGDSDGKESAELHESLRLEQEQKWKNSLVARDNSQLKCAWNANAVRTAMGVESTGCQKPGYLDLPNVERDKVEAVVQAAIKLDMYAVVDYHTEKAQEFLDKAKEFFTYFASKYGKYPNIIYEPFNEPTTDWKTAKAYHEQIVATIRTYDKNNMITLGILHGHKMLILLLETL
uniref:Glycoside hydrolase family 5 domain-containing protein n=1 Tax=Meloidogyne javanica TaxID=6303 RepID=A0A915MVC4_MELJA